MAQYKPTLESIEPNFGHSFTYARYDAYNHNENIFWHYHPEIELVYVNGGNGKRHIGSHVSYYKNGDLILIGSNLPHCGFTDSLTGNRSETVIQMKADFLGDQFFSIPEMKQIATLFEKAQGGMAFRGASKDRIGAKIEALQDESEFNRLLGILSILNDLGQSDEFAILNANGLAIQTVAGDNDRIEKVFNYVHEHYREEISLEEIAGLVSMTPPSFCRYFKKTTNKTFVQFVNECRLVQASKLLTEQRLSITDICFESGFNNFSHFAKSFKKFTGQTPSAYRGTLKRVLQ
ncbi:AraC family transcriptional regulator [Gangjinia marincola]|uniref:AraC family transcriptional regulator n=1 Tax=Gangjinia marincola TaxID=578463 RepID=A0ABN1ME05_9FLAO